MTGRSPRRRAAPEIVRGVPRDEAGAVLELYRTSDWIIYQRARS